MPVAHQPRARLRASLICLNRDRRTGLIRIKPAPARGLTLPSHWHIRATAQSVMKGQTMKNRPVFVRTALAAGLLAACAGASAEVDVAALQQRLEQMEREMQALRAELAKVAAEEPKQTQKVQEIETRVAKVESAPAAQKVIGNRVFFRGGYATLSEDRSNGAFTDMINVPGAIGLPAINNTSDDGWYFGAGFDFLLSRDTLGLLPGVWTIAELGVEFRSLGGEDAHLVGPVAECLLLNELGIGAGPVNCTNIKGEENLMMLTVSASPKLKFMEGSKLRPWIIPAGFDVNVISPPSDSTNYLDVGVQFGAGLDYEFMPGITLGADVRYHLSANLTDPDYGPTATAAAAAAGRAAETDHSNDARTAGVSLGNGVLRPAARPSVGPWDGGRIRPDPAPFSVSRVQVAATRDPPAAGTTPRRRTAAAATGSRCGCRR